MMYSGKLSREKTFVNFAVLWLFVEVFSAKFGVLWHSKSNHETFVSENHIFQQFAKVFSLKSFPLYGNNMGSISTHVSEALSVVVHLKTMFLLRN